MFELNVEEYCADCPHFEVVCESFEYETFDSSVRSEHMITCKHKEKCEAIKEYLNRKMLI